MTVLTVEKKPEGLLVSFPKNHPKAKQIDAWLKNVSPGYTEYLIKHGCDPHCSACRADDCDNVGMGDDACAGFMWGEEW